MLKNAEKPSVELCRRRDKHRPSVRLHSRGGGRLKLKGRDRCKRICKWPSWSRKWRWTSVPHLKSAAKRMRRENQRKRGVARSQRNARASQGDHQGPHPAATRALVIQKWVHARLPLFLDKEWFQMRQWECTQPWVWAQLWVWTLAWWVVLILS